MLIVFNLALRVRLKAKSGNQIHCIVPSMSLFVTLNWICISPGGLCGSRRKKMPTTIILSYINHLLEKKGQTFIAVVFVFLFQF